MYWILKYASSIEVGDDVRSDCLILNPRRNSALLVNFGIAKLEQTLTITASTVNQIKEQAAQFAAARKALDAAEVARRASDEGRAAVEAELATLRAQVAAARKANQAVPDPPDYDEAATRDAFIDLLLMEGRLAAYPTRRPRIPGKRHAQPTR